jgi:hypothetical protein
MPAGSTVLVIPAGMLSSKAAEAPGLGTSVLEGIIPDSFRVRPGDSALGCLVLLAFLWPFELGASSVAVMAVLSMIHLGFGF